MSAHIFVIAFVVVVLAVLGMAVGVIFGGRRIQGSCGGLGNLPGPNGGCPACSRKRRQKAEAAGSSTNLAREPQRCSHGSVAPCSPKGDRSIFS
ncbi:MAG: (Na+)-NQR maturation NqrM [Gammaproteobacteria bacterium]|nr:(Na+)-NQR maturation NqrM [Gammaproteobacteria bacterium]NIR83348.1 (Na+)-NQR maturation NqrM [Gammaproteobacteria bacterium]NIR91148.1 (Na+)-NQR maturation NqrM [Gammaproteobacteria bacterium]NIU04515.1 (Na+)-NQR maturation NqrM [Gammaproteobacteria bacterium]NIW87151.1 (Na+)-NQR maturation NqrM [Gammaproteobacteria bacterium]